MRRAELEEGVTFTAPLWEWDGDAAWHFVTVPQDLSDEIEFVTASTGGARGFGSARVEVVVGATTWRTSVFPDRRRAAYVLPVKQAVRRAEDLRVGEDVRVTLRLVAA